MSFAAIETSRSLGAPFALFLFRYGPGVTDFYALTTAEEPITFGEYVYAPVPIHTENAVSSGALDDATLEVRLPKTLSVAQLFNTWPPSYPITLQIYQGNVGQADCQPLWSGRIIQHRIEVDDMIFTCEPISSALRRSGLRRNYQYSCPHVLYGSQCRAPQANFTITAVVQAVATPYVTLPPGWASDTDQPHYVNGFVSWQNAAGHTEYRTLLVIQSETVIRLSGDCSSLAEGMTLSLSKGCNHQTSDCLNVFNNIVNYGGCPWIPVKNPFGIVDNFN